MGQEQEHHPISAPQIQKTVSLSTTKSPSKAPVINPQPGQVVFRVICHYSFIGGLIGPSGSVISKIRGDTSCIVHCNNAEDEALEHRVIVIVGSAISKRKIELQTKEGNRVVETKIVSGAQEAVIRVLERMWEVDKHMEGGKDDGDGTNITDGYCGLLVNRNQIGVVLGKRGSRIETIRNGCEAHITIMQAPPCAPKEDKLIQITGSTVEVKKAVIAVTRCLQLSPMYVENGCSPRASDPLIALFPTLNSLLPPINNTNTGHSGDVECKLGDVLFRLVCSIGAAGSIIGKMGSVVRILTQITRVSISVAAPSNTDSCDRVILVSATENLKSWVSPAQNALVLVFARSVEHDIKNGGPSGLVGGATVTARLLVPSNVVCCLGAKGRELDPEMLESTDSVIKIKEGHLISDCATDDDAEIQINGWYANVQNALFQLTCKIRNHLLIKVNQQHPDASDSRDEQFPISFVDVDGTISGDERFASRGVDAGGTDPLRDQKSSPCVVADANCTPQEALTLFASSEPKDLEVHDDGGFVGLPNKG